MTLASTDIFVFPVSFAQQRLWFLDRFEPGSPFYNLPTVIRLQGKLDVDILEQSFQAIAQRHESLRTTFTTVDGQPVQEISSQLDFAVQIVDLKALSATEREVQAQTLATQEAQRPFDLECAPLFRVTLLQLEEEEQILLLTMHHIISDGWSMGVLLRELAALYKAFAAKEPSPLPELPIQYADFAIWQRDWLQGEVLASQIAYWKEQLADAPPLLTLPSDRPRPLEQTFRGATQVFELSEALTTALKALSQQEDVTLFMTLLAAFKVLLSRYTGQDDVVVGSAISNRNRAEIEGLIGFFVNTLVLRTDLAGNPSFKTLLRRVRETTIAAYAHQDLPFEKLVDELQPERSLSHNPLFQVMFQLRNAPMPSLQLDKLTLTPVEVEQGTTQFDLSFDVTELARSLQVSVEYSTDLFDSSTIRRMFAHFQTLLTAIVANPEQCIERLSLLTPDEQQQLGEIGRWGAGDAGDAGGEITVHSLFEAQVERTPDAVAVVFENQQLSYLELNQRANKIACYLQKLGVKPETLVGICVERSVDMVAGMLGVLKAGGAYLPLDPSYPQERIDFMLADAQVSVLLTQQHLISWLPENQAQIICLDTDWETIVLAASPAQEAAPSAPSPSNLAYVIYTSGSTGKAKGVMVEHRQLVNAYWGWEEVYQLQSSARTHLQMASFSFDVFTGDVVRALCSGGKLVLCPRDRLLAPHLLYNLIQEHQVDCAEFVPVVLRNLIQYLEQSNQRLDWMRLLICGSDVWYGEEYEKFRQFCGETRLINSFGVTEATIDSSYFESVEALRTGQLVPIGKPFPHTQLYILDQYLQPVPIGVKGELYIGGAGVTRGYLNRPDLTAEKFITIAHNDDNKCNRLYKTGDAARYLADGNIEFIGRLDYQIKINGFRIELGEIETAVNQYPAIKESVVIAREDIPGDKRLVAYIVQNQQYFKSDALLPKLAAERIAHWQTVYDNDFLNESLANTDPTFNIGGWNNSYTGQLIPEVEMRQWLDNTVKRILALNPKRVLEIGCGTGLILFRVAPSCNEYYGVDFSQTALRDTKKVLAIPEYSLPHVRLKQRMADDFTGIEAESFDTVIINSVIQYFPNIDYLIRVLKGATKAVAPGGSIFIGDVRSLPLLETFHTSVQLYQADDCLAINELRDRIHKRIAQEQELAINPAFFTALKSLLPRISKVKIELKKDKINNELSKFRYDVTLQIESVVDSWDDCLELDWHPQLTLDDVRQLLEVKKPNGFRVNNVLNTRLLNDIQAVEIINSKQVNTAGDVRLALAQITPASLITPENWYELEKKLLEYAVELSWLAAKKDGSYDVIFRRRTTTTTFSQNIPTPVTLHPWHTYANNPLQGKQVHELIPQLRIYLQNKLPEYMLPAAFVVLDALPLTPNGKIDRRSLPAPERPQTKAKQASNAPLTATETQLIEIWQQVLGVEEIGIHNNFFELGGDSILTIQIIAKANKIGLQITPKQMFQHQTIAQLASVVGENRVTSFTQGLVTGNVPLTPIQHWFFEQNFIDPQHWNQAVLLEVERLDSQLLKQVVQHLLKHHDALRLRFVQSNSTWRQFNAVDGVVPVTVLDLSMLSTEQQISAMEAAATEIQASFNLSAEPLLKVALFDFGENKPSRLLFVIHHLAVDGVSWRILLEDFETAYQQLQQGEAIQLPAKTTSFQQWAKCLNTYANSAEINQELDYWLAQIPQQVTSLPLDYVEGSNKVETAKTISVTLSFAETQLLLQEVPKTYNTQINDVLLTALVQAFYQWTQESYLLIDLEGHGREEVFADLDLSRTIGWFTSQFPLFIKFEDKQIGENLKSIKEQLRRIPNCGFGYGILRYLRGNCELAKQPQAQVNFNYFGQFDRVLSQSSLGKLAKESTGISHSLRDDRTYVLEINSFVTEGCLQLDWTYSTAMHKPSTIAKLAQDYIQALRSLITHCQSPNTGGYTPSDFADFEWSQWNQTDLDTILTAIGDV